MIETINEEQINKELNALDKQLQKARIKRILQEIKEHNSEIDRLVQTLEKALVEDNKL